MTTNTRPSGHTPETDITQPPVGAGVQHEKNRTLARDSPVLGTRPRCGCWYLLKHAAIRRRVEGPGNILAARRRIVIKINTRGAALVRTSSWRGPTEHRELRNLCHCVTPKTRSMRVAARTQSSIMEEAAAMGTCDFVMDVAGELPMQTINQMMDVPEVHRKRIVTLADEVIAGGGGRDRGAAEDPGAQLGALGYEMASARKGNNGTDLIRSAQGT